MKFRAAPVLFAIFYLCLLVALTTIIVGVTYLGGHI